MIMFKQVQIYILNILKSFGERFWATLISYKKSYVANIL